MTSRCLILLLCLLPFLRVAAATPPPVEGFTASPIPDAVWQRMQGRSYHPGCPVGRDELRYLRLLHYNLEGEVKTGELVCHKKLAADLLAIFRQLFEARYPIERMSLVDDYGADDVRSMQANNTSCFNHRRIAGTNRLSLHSYGCAVDLNPLYNPWVSADGKKVSPKQGRPYARRSHPSPYVIKQGDLALRLFRRYGFTWGGSWRRAKDYQHFEKKLSQP